MLLSPVSLGSGTTVYVYSALGELAAEYGPATGEYGRQFVTGDHLGSTRVVTDGAGAVAKRYDYLPYGEEIPAGVGGRTAALGYVAANGADTQTVKFTGQVRDAESGLDYFGARYYSGAQGRFTSADEPFADQDPADPQSWNLYAYGRNNPLRYVDRTGREATVTIETDEKKKTGTINVSASIAFYAAKGSGLSAQQVQAAAAAAQKSIQSAWSGGFKKDGISYTVNTQISVQVVADEAGGKAAGAQNVIGLTKGNAIPGRADSFVNPAGLWASITGGPDTGTWNVQNLGIGVGAHEYTHLMGVDDHSGNVLSNTNLLNNAAIPRAATATDYGWALGGAIDAHRAASRSFSLWPFGYSQPQSSRSVRTVRAPSPFGSWR